MLNNESAVTVLFEFSKVISDVYFSPFGTVSEFETVLEPFVCSFDIGLEVLAFEGFSTTSSAPAVTPHVPTSNMVRITPHNPYVLFFLNPTTFFLAYVFSFSTDIFLLIHFMSISALN